MVFNMDSLFNMYATIIAYFQRKTEQNTFLHHFDDIKENTGTNF